MRALFLFLIMLAMCQVTVAQRRPVDEQLTQRFYNGRWFAKFNFASIIDPLTPTLQPGIEYRVNKRVALEFTAGIPIRTFREARSTDFTFYKYYKLKAELHFFPEGRFFYWALRYFSRIKGRANTMAWCLGRTIKIIHTGMPN